MKIMTLFGTRPEIIRLCLIIEILDRHCDQVLVHTGQNYDPALSDIFLAELGVRPVDYHLGIRSSTFGDQAGQILIKTEQLLQTEKPDRLVVLGDTNSGLSALVAARHGIPVYHLEAGNRCYDNRVPEEINRRVIDHSSAVLLPYTERSAENLVAEGIRRERIFVTGNPIGEVLDRFAPQIRRSTVVRRLGLKRGGYFLVTLHRAENVDSPTRLRQLIRGLSKLAASLGKPALLSVHPRTADRLKQGRFVVDEKLVRFEKPWGFFDFVQLERNALGIVTDSGTVQEEACLLGIPNVTIRDVTERPETLECGSNILSGSDDEMLLTGMKLALSCRGSWSPPREYRKAKVSVTVAKIVLGFSANR